MIPFIDIPSVITNFIKPFNLSYHQKKHMERYTSGIIASENKTITGITSQFMDETSSKALNRFLTEYEWNNSEVNKQRLQELQKYNETRWSKKGVGIIDDTLVKKTGKKIPFSGKFYDHVEKKFVHAISLITLHYADHKVNYPTDFRIYEKEKDTEESEEFSTKLELAMKMIQTSEMPVMTFVFDSWYTCQEMKDFIEALGKRWIGSCKSSLLVRVGGNEFVSLKEYEKRNSEKFVDTEINGKRFRTFVSSAFMKRLGKVRLIISRDEEGVVYLATNRKDNRKKVLSDYMLRGKIDAFYKDAKHHLGLEDCEVRNPVGVQRHFTMVFLSHSILRLGVAESKILATIGKSRKNIILELLERFVFWILEKGENAMKELGGVMLKYRQS